MSAIERLDRFQRRHPPVGFPLAVVYKFLDDRGPHLAALITYYGFLSLFPLLLLFTSVLGFVLEDNPELQQRVMDSALSSFPLLRSQLQENIGEFQGSGVGLTIGIVGTLYGGLGVMQAAQAALNRVYAVPRFAQPNPLTARLRGFLLVLALGLAALVSTALSTFVLTVGELVRTLNALVPVAAALAGFVVNVGIFVVLYQALTARYLGWRNVLVGSVIAAVLWQLLQTFGTYYFGSYLSRTTDVYGIFGTILGLLVWIYLQALVVILAAEINVVRHRRLYPRALMSPFTDDVDLTESDVRAYTGYARSERYKEFERVDASFHRDGEPRPAPPEGFPGDVAQDEREKDERDGRT